MTLQPRAPRLDVSFPLEFSVSGLQFTGNCCNLSASGLLAIFAVEPELWTQGDLRLCYGGSSSTLRCRVSRVQEHHVGFSFLVANPGDRETIQQILQFAVAHTHLVGPPPF